MKLNYENLKKCFFYNLLSYPTPFKNREFPKTSIKQLLDLIRKNEVQIRNQHPQIHQNSYIKPQITDPPSNLLRCELSLKKHAFSCFVCHIDCYIYETLQYNALIICVRHK